MNKTQVNLLVMALLSLTLAFASIVSNKPLFQAMSAILVLLAGLYAFLAKEIQHSTVIEVFGFLLGFFFMILGLNILVGGVLAILFGAQYSFVFACALTLSMFMLYVSAGMFNQWDPPLSPKSLN